MPLPTTRSCGSCLVTQPGSTEDIRSRWTPIRMVFASHPSAADGQSGLAQVYSQMGRTSEAEQILKKLVASDPGRRNDLMLLGDLSMSSKDYSGAVDWLKKAEAIAPDARSEVLLAICYGQLKQIGPGGPLSCKWQSGARRITPMYCAPWPDTIAKSESIPDAIAALKSIHNPAPDVVAELAYTYQLDGKYNESAQLYSQAANDEPRDLTLQFSAARAEIAIGDRIAQ